MHLQLPAVPPSPGGTSAENQTPFLSQDDDWSRRFGSKSIAALFFEQAEATPLAPALRDRFGILTYQQLAQESARLAVRLQQCGVSPGQIVIVETVRTRESIIALVAVLSIGAAYLALDTESPPERFAALLTAARPAIVLRQAACERTLPEFEIPTLDLDAELSSLRSAPTATPLTFSPFDTAPHDLAYVTLTSGSTGTPKGVCIPHRGVIRLVKEPNYVTIRPEDIVLRFAPLSFDASTFEIWGALLNGASLAIFPPEKPSLTEIGEFIERQKVSLLWLTAGLFHQMAEHHLHYLHDVRQLIVGGDVLSPPHVRSALRQLPQCRLINGYGPSENTTFTCCHHIQSLPEMALSVPIGAPISRTYCRVLDPAGQLVEPGSPGELYIGGDGLALGYLGDPTLTAHSFVHDPFSSDPGARLYRSGDRARLLANGTYSFLGRVDRQVKVSGVRVELDEIEAALALHPFVRESVVHLVRTVSGYEQLVATVALRHGSEASVEDLRAFLRARLPAYMVPASWTFLAALPLNSTGKLDRAKLRAGPPAEAAREISTSATTAQALVEIWREVLGPTDFGPDHDFFALGGTSLRATHLLARIRTVLGKTVPMSVLLERGTIAQLALYLDQVPRTTTSPLHTFRSAGIKPPLFCLPSYAGDLMCYGDLERYFAPGRPVYGIQSQRFLGGPEADTIEGIAAACLSTILRQRKTGPYHLFGFCFGGLVAYEVACQLVDRGATVGMVGILDYEFPDPDPTHSWRRRPTALLAFTRNLLLAFAELRRTSKLDRDSALQRIALRLRGLLRGQGWDEALRTGLGYHPALEQERVYDLHDRAWQSYIPRPYPGTVTLLRAHRLPIFRSHDPTLGWCAIPCAQLQVKVQAGGWHGAALREPHSPSFARSLEESMKAAEA